jgi:hypothetical protein
MASSLDSPSERAVRLAHELGWTVGGLCNRPAAIAELGMQRELRAMLVGLGADDLASRIDVPPSEAADHPTSDVQPAIAVDLVRALHTALLDKLAGTDLAMLRSYELGSQLAQLTGVWPRRCDGDHDGDGDGDNGDDRDPVPTVKAVELRSAFAPATVETMAEALGELAAAVGPYRVAPVVQSLRRWADAVERMDRVRASSSERSLRAPMVGPPAPRAMSETVDARQEGEGTSRVPVRPSHLRSHLRNAVSLLALLATKGTTQATAAARPLDPDTLALALREQGREWRAVLLGHRSIADLLSSDEQARVGIYADHGLETIRRAAASSWQRPLLITWSLSLAVAVVVGVAIGGPAAPRVAIALALLVVTAAAWWAMLRARTEPLAARLADRLVQSATVDVVTELITVAPVGGTGAHLAAEEPLTFESSQRGPQDPDDSVGDGPAGSAARAETEPQIEIDPDATAAVPVVTPGTNEPGARNDADGDPTEVLSPSALFFEDTQRLRR